MLEIRFEMLNLETDSLQVLLCVYVGVSLPWKHTVSQRMKLHTTSGTAGMDRRANTRTIDG